MSPILAGIVVGLLTATLIMLIGGLLIIVSMLAEHPHHQPAARGNDHGGEVSNHNGADT